MTQKTADLTPLTSPADFELTINDIFDDIAKTTVYSPFLPVCHTIIDLAKNSISDPKLITKINDILSTIPTSDFDRFIHLFHNLMFIQGLDSDLYAQDQDVYSVTPVTDAVKALLKVTGISTAVNALSIHLIDVLTSHPVDMDRGLVINHKQRLAKVHQWWGAHKKAYPYIQDISVKLAARSQLNDFSRQIRDGLFQLIHTENYRKNKIKPESEQRNLSRAIKENELKAVSYWLNLVRVVQFIFIEAIMDELVIKDSALKKTFNQLYSLARTTENLKQFSEITEIKNHPSFDDIMTLESRLKYELEVWRGDMDGNPFVNGQTVALSIAYGRKRSFERLSADNAVIRYNPKTTTFEILEKEMSKRLIQFKKTGEPAWKRYIKGREAELWTPVQIYSGLMYYRMVELTEAAELYTRTLADTQLLSVGVKTKADFLNDTDVLEAAEHASGIQNGTWTICRRLVNLRGLALGQPHIRKGEAFNLELLNTLVPGLKDAKTADDKKNILKKGVIRLPVTQSGPKNTDLASLLQSYLDVIKFEPDTTLVQSDSGITGDIELSILILKTLSQLIGHTGQVVVLCEDKASMELAI